MNGHDDPCSKGILTKDNEDSCDVDPKDSTKCKCVHKVPDDKILDLPAGFMVIFDRKTVISRKGKKAKKRISRIKRKRKVTTVKRRR